MDSTRAEIIHLFSELCEEANIPTLRFPGDYSNTFAA